MSCEHVEAEAQHSLTSFDYMCGGFSYSSPKCTITVLKTHSYRTQSDQLPYSCPPEVDPGTVLTVFSYRSLASHVYHRIVPGSWLDLSPYLARLSPVIWSSCTERFESQIGRLTVKWTLPTKPVRLRRRHFRDGNCNYRTQWRRGEYGVRKALAQNKISTCQVSGT